MQVNPLIGGGLAMGTSQNSPSQAMDRSNGQLVIDETPMRVVTIALAAALSLAALRWAGFRFNVGVSG